MLSMAEESSGTATDIIDSTFSTQATADIQRGALETELRVAAERPVLQAELEAQLAAERAVLQTELQAAQEAGRLEAETAVLQAKLQDRRQMGDRMLRKRTMCGRYSQLHALTVLNRVKCST